MSLSELMGEITNGSAGTAWLRTSVIVIAFGVMLWFDPRISYMQGQITDNAAAIKIMDGQGTRHSSQAEIAMQAEIKSNTDRIKKLEDRYDKIDNALSAILNKLGTKP